MNSGAFSKIVVNGRKLLLLLCLNSIWLTIGCVYIPTPPYYAAGSRQNVTAQSTNLISAGTTTIEDTFLKLGEPDFISADEQTIAYSSKKIVAQLYVYADTDGSELPDVPQYHFLNITLDGQGIVTNCEFIKRQYFDELNSLLKGLINGEAVKIAFQSWYSDTDGRNSVGVPVLGDFFLTETSLYFVSKTQWLNDKPVIDLKYDAIAECWNTKSGIDNPALIVRTKNNRFYSFTICDWGRRAKKTVEEARILVQFRLNPSDHK